MVTTVPLPYVVRSSFWTDCRMALLLNMNMNFCQSV